MEEIEILKQEIKTMIDNADEKTVRMTYAMLEAGAKEDWWDELNNDEKEEMEKAIEESEKADNHIPLEKFQSDFSQWRKKLLSSNEQNKK